MRGQCSGPIDRQTGGEIRLCWQSGVFVTVDNAAAASDFGAIAAQKRAGRVFLDMLVNFEAEGRHVSPPTPPTSRRPHSARIRAPNVSISVGSRLPWAACSPQAGSRSGNHLALPQGRRTLSSTAGAGEHLNDPCTTPFRLGAPLYARPLRYSPSEYALLPASAGPPYPLQARCALFETGRRRSKRGTRSTSIPSRCCA